MRQGIFLFLVLVVLVAQEAWAQEEQPGDACSTSGQLGFFGGPVEPDGQFMVCDGTVWVDFISWTTSGQVGVSTTSVPSTMTFIANGPMGAVQYCDENGGDCFTAASAAGGLWTQSGSDIYYDSGNVSIGTTTATDPLAVVGDMRLYGYGVAGNKADLNFYRARGSEGSEADLQLGDILGSIRFYTRHTNTYFEGAQIYAVKSFSGGNRNTDLVFKVGSGAGFEEKMRLNDGGFLGLGDTDPDAKLEISADGSTSGNALLISSDDDNDGDYLTFTRTGLMGIGITSPNVALDVSGSIEFTGTTRDVSDRRLKNKIAALPEQLDNVLKLKPVSFEMKDAPGVIEYGLIAQDVEDVYPVLVNTADDDMGTKSMNYMGLIAPMLKAMQEQQAFIEKQQESINQQQKAMQEQQVMVEAQQTEINTLKSRLKALEAR